MYVCEGRVNSQKYVSVLENALLPSFSHIYGDTNMNNVQFQQDNAPCHKSAFTMKWLEENKIPLLEWPPQSPDLNPIEHLWALLKRKMLTHSIQSKSHLKLLLTQEWNAITVAECEKLVACMPKRIAAVIKAKGGVTKY